MSVPLSVPQERILLELFGRGRAISVRDLCETIGIDPSDCMRACTGLWLADMIKRQYGFEEGSDNAWYSITWIGEKWLADRPRPSTAPVPRRRWFRLARSSAKAGE